VLSTLAANHTKALSDDHGLTSSLIGGYQVAFLAGAVSIATGIVLAFALLRPRNPAAEIAGEGSPRVPTTFDLEEKAA
jgi:ABC-type spermidine/putrescine transport system permease subunit II